MVNISENHSIGPTRKTVAIIQGRMASSRLPDKILKDINGKPMLAWVVDQARKARFIDQVVVATTLDPSDDAVEIYCHKNHILCYRGSMHDVLDRFYQAARLYQADVVVRFTADCPLLDPQLVDRVLEEFLMRGQILLPTACRRRSRGHIPSAWIPKWQLSRHWKEPGKRRPLNTIENM